MVPLSFTTPLLSSLKVDLDRTRKLVVKRSISITKMAFRIDILYHEISTPLYSTIIQKREEEKRRRLFEKIKNIIDIQIIRKDTPFIQTPLLTLSLLSLIDSYSIPISHHCQSVNEQLANQRRH